MPKYSLDVKAAKNADNNFRGIDTSGAYVGKITLAEEVTSKQGAFGIELSFEDETGAKANYLTMWIEKANGEKIFGYQQLNSLLTCLSLREIIPVEQVVKKYDIGAKAEIDTQVVAHPDLMNEPIGVILQKEEYIKNNGDIGYKMNIKHFFKADTKQFAIEILNKEESKLYSKLKDEYKDKLLQAQVQHEYTNNTNPSIDIDDEIPF